MGGDRETLDRRVRIPLEQDAVAVRAGIPFVRVHDDISRRLGLRDDGAPLPSGGEGRAAPAAQPRRLDRLDQRLARDALRLLERRVAAVSFESERANARPLQQDGARCAHLDARQAVVLERGWREVAVAETVERRVLRQRCRPAVGIAVAGDEAGRSATEPRQTAAEMVEGRDLRSGAG